MATLSQKASPVPGYDMPRKVVGTGLAAVASYQHAKPVIDWMLAALLLVLTAPIMLLAMAAVILTSRGSVIYSQERLGRNAKRFKIFKIRTMYDRCEASTGPVWALPSGDPRVTLVGRFLRKTHIDEFPQLWNVLRGEMSLVGPRPERPEFVSELETAIPRYRDRMLVRPGITGLAQVQLPPDTTLDDVKRKLTCDLYYIHRANFWLDVRILLSTVSNLAGIPSAFVLAFLRIPSGEPVERAYWALVETGAST
jgi:lipopolysaccharide/colanic/teichoic acid biosynthesis glycosyltransferase